MQKMLHFEFDIADPRLAYWKIEPRFMVLLLLQMSSPHVAARIINVHQGWMHLAVGCGKHLDPLLSHHPGALSRVKPDVRLAKIIIDT